MSKDMKIIAYIRSVFFCIHFLNLSDAIKAPIYISHKMRIIKKKGAKIIINGKINRHMISIGLSEDSLGIKSNGCFELILAENSKLVFNGKSVISKGGTLRVEKNCFIYVADKVSIGANCIIGWNCQIRDNDGHQIFVDDNVCNYNAPITIGYNVWICSDCTILKGTNLPDSSVLAANSVLVDKKKDSNVIYGGFPAKAIKKITRWEK